MAEDENHPKKKRVTKRDKKSKKNYSRYKKGGPKKKRIKL
tara:strand:- start:321 stop:440 length:120 start_codon:yes stop_codon:yes gene_type:complete